jgi:Tol biopolymer transport system component
VLERVGGQFVTRGYSVSAAGVLVQHDAEGSLTRGPNRLIIVDPGRGADTVRLPPARRAYPRFSPNGRSIAMEVYPDGRNGETDIYTLDLVTGTYTQLTFAGDNDEPVWSPDGRRILFDKEVATSPALEDLFIKPADNSGPERRLTTMRSREIGAQQWIDDHTILFDALVPERAADIFTVAADSGSAPVPYLRSPFAETEPRLSPDRKLLVFTSNETGTNQVWMRDFPVPQGKWNISVGAGRAARWSPDGRYVYFWRGGAPLDTLLRARIDRTPTVVVHAPEVVFTIDADGLQNWDLHPDGRRFIVAAVISEPAATAAGASKSRYLILQNWFGELRRLTTAKPR